MRSHRGIHTLIYGMFCSPLKPWIWDESNKKIIFLHFKWHTTPVSEISSYLQTEKGHGIQKNSK